MSKDQNIQNNVLVVIPVYNHLENVCAVARGCLKFDCEVLVVDDGSQGDIVSVLDGLDVALIRHEQNCGKGHALLSGAKYAASKGKTHIITIDADGQHSPERIPDFLKAIESNSSAIIIGVRDFNRADNVPAGSKFGRAFGNFWVRIQTGVCVRDIQSGYRAYPVFPLLNMRFFFGTYAFEDEVVVRVAWANLPVVEIEIDVYYPPGDQRISHFNKLSDNIKLTILNTYLTIRAVLPWPHQKICYENGKFYTIYHPVKLIREGLCGSSTPLKLGLAVGIGVLLGALPLIACHTIAIIYVTALLRLNKSLAIFSSQICAPPLMPALCIEAGHWLRNGRFLVLQDISSLSDSTFLELGHVGAKMILDWFTGSLVIGPFFALIVGFVAFLLSFFIRKKLLCKS